MQDRNFDDIAEKFSRNIYGTTKGQLRQAILWQDLDRVLAEMGPQKLRVLDAGGGEGQTAIKMAERGHQVILCDLSAQMIDRAKQAAEAKGVSDNMQFIHCAAQDVASHLETPVDLILFHAVLEWVADPRSVLQTLWSVLRPGGVLSLMFYNAHGLLMHNMVAGNFDYVQAGMPKKKKRTLSPDYPRDPAQVYLWLEEAGWQIMGRDWLVNLLNQCDELGIRNQFEVEVLSYGHLPLAYSARCFTARSEDRPKDECETCCIKYPNGRNVLSQENQQVFVLNGIQTMSGYVYNLGNELASMQGLVDVVRLSPQGTDTFAMLDAFRANENGAAPLPLTANSDCNGYWRRLAGLELQA